MIIETTCNRFYQVRDTGDANLAHVWFGIEVKRVKANRPASNGQANGFTLTFDWAPKKGARETLVRKEASRVVVP